MIAFLLSLFYFFYFSIIAVHIIFMPKVLSQLGYIPLEIGIIFATAPLVRFAIPFAFMRHFQLTKQMFHTALLILFSSALLFFYFRLNFYGLLLANIGLGIGLALVLPFMEVLALQRIGKSAYGKVRLWGSIGFILVSLLLVKLLNTPINAFLFLMATTLFTAITGYIAARGTHQPKNQEIRSSWRKLHINEYWLWGGLILMQVSFGAFYNFFTIYETERGITLNTTIWLWSFGVIIEIFMLYFQAPLMRKNLLTILQLCSAITVIRWLLLFAFPTVVPLLFFAQALHAFSFALFHSAAISYLFQTYHNKQLTQQFFLGTSYGLGGFIGSLIAGVVYQYWPNMLFLSAALFALFSALALKKAASSQ